MSLPSSARRGIALVVSGGLGILTVAADATGCPVCFAADERTRTTFVQTAVLLSLLPFALFGFIALWLLHELRGNPGAGPAAGMDPSMRNDRPAPARSGDRGESGGHAVSSQA